MHSKPKIVVISGAGISAESGLATFRDSNGLWNNHRVENVATPEAWARNPQLVLDFYNARRAQAWVAEPNAGHLALAELERAFDVRIITQNVDGLHEKAGSTQVLHLHGELSFARGISVAQHRVYLQDAPIALGDKCPDGTQLRPDIVWFGEAVPAMEAAMQQVQNADKVLVVGTSLAVYPAASLVHYARRAKEKVLVALDVEFCPSDYEFMRGKAGDVLPVLAKRWLEESL